MISNNHISQIVLVRSVTSSGSQWHSAVSAGANASCSDKACGHCVSLAKSSSAIQFVIGRCVRAPERNANVSGKRCFHSKRPKTTSNCQAVSPQRLPPSEVLRMAMKRVRFGELFQSAEFPPIAGGVPSASVHEFFFPRAGRMGRSTLHAPGRMFSIFAPRRRQRGVRPNYWISTSRAA